MKEDIIEIKVFEPDVAQSFADQVSQLPRQLGLDFEEGLLEYVGVPFYHYDLKAELPKPESIKNLNKLIQNEFHSLFTEVNQAI